MFTSTLVRYTEAEDLRNNYLPLSPPSSPSPSLQLVIKVMSEQVLLETQVAMPERFMSKQYPWIHRKVCALLLLVCVCVCSIVLLLFLKTLHFH